MAFTDIEIAEHMKVLEDAFWSRRRPPLHLRDQVREGQRFTDQSIELFIVRPAFNLPGEYIEESIAKGISVHEIRRRIKERKEQGRATERIGERVGNYTASVQGPSGRGANDKMRAAVEALLQKLKLNHS